MSFWNGSSAGNHSNQQHETNSTYLSGTSSANGSDDVNIELSKMEERDEIQELHKLARKDTCRIRMWRLLVIASLIITGTACTITFYQYLRDEQKDNYERGYVQFSQAAHTMTLKMHMTVLKNIKSFAQMYAEVGHAMNTTWPFYTMPNFDLHAAAFLQRTGAEVVMTSHVVYDKDAESWLNFTAPTVAMEESATEDHSISFSMKKLTPDGWVRDEPNRSVYTAMWQQAPSNFYSGLINYNPNFILAEQGGPYQALAGETIMTPFKTYNRNIMSDKFNELHQAMHTFQEGSQVDHPHVWFVHPIYPDPAVDINAIISETSNPRQHQTATSTLELPPVVAHLATIISLDHCLINLLPANVHGLRAVLKNSCGEAHTYELNGKNANYIGEGELYDEAFESMKVETDLALHINANFRNTPGHCLYSMNIYPSAAFQDIYETNSPKWIAGGLAIIFTAVICIFWIYDNFVERRNFRLIANAARSNTIVSAMFPGNFRDKFINNEEQQRLLDRRFSGTSQKLKAFINKNLGGGLGTEPLAELYLETTVIFADIVGFTAWSSVREPTQIFLLLETIYNAFDVLAKRRRVYKVETIGDCYIAIAGLHEPRKDHAIVMARFARDIRRCMKTLTREVETIFGPDTSTLSIRIGLHSGPVTAGVLRGDRPRFQLFGDTINTCALMESTGEAGQIQVSQETANAIAKYGKKSWVRPRVDNKEGKLDSSTKAQTYWLTFGANLKGIAGSVWDGPTHDSFLNRSSVHLKHEESIANLSRRDSNSSSSSVSLDSDDIDTESRMERLVEWNVDKLAAILREIVARRQNSAIRLQSHDDTILRKETTPLEEVKEIIYLPDFDDKNDAVEQTNGASLSPTVIVELREYITCISKMYHDNSFHNFDHASHVVMSVTKLMSRIVAPSELDCEDDRFVKTLHDHTYGITSDPLTQFACAFSALIHDVDHLGVPNPQVVKERPALAEMYKNRSVAEQNSLDLSWDLFMHAKFENLRRVLCGTKEELRRFRQLVVNAVMATDIMDKELKELRNGRWTKAFQERSDEGTKAALNRKATIVIEHIIQASDVAHTMQHWHVYRKWNERLFREMYQAYREGRAEKDPSEFWYKGEIGFLDFYVIPLAKKLKDCGVFGVSSGEYLNYAQQNRKQWTSKGEEVVKSMVASMHMDSEAPPKEAPPSSSSSMLIFEASSCRGSTYDFDLDVESGNTDAE